MKRMILLLACILIIATGCKSQYSAIDLDQINTEELDWTDDMHANPTNYTTYTHALDARIRESNGLHMNWGMGNIHLDFVPGDQLTGELKVIIQGGDIKTRENFLKDLHFSMGAELANAIRTLEVEHMPTHTSPWSHQARTDENLSLAIHVNLKVPNHIKKLKLTNSVGHIIVENFTGELKASSDIGTIAITNSEVAVNLYSGSGNVKLKDLVLEKESTINLSDGSIILDHTLWQDAKSITISQGLGDIQFLVEEDDEVAVRDSILEQRPWNIEQGMGEIMINKQCVTN